MVNREMKLAIGDELQTPFLPIVNTNKQTAEEIRKELAPMNKTLTDVDGALAAQRGAEAPPLNKNADITFGIYKKRDGQLGMGSKVVRFDVNRKVITVDDREYKLTPGILVLITQTHPRAVQWNSKDYKAYKSLVAQTKVKSFQNRITGAARPHASW